MDVDFFLRILLRYIFFLFFFFLVKFMVLVDMKEISF